MVCSPDESHTAVCFAVFDRCVFRLPIGHYVLLHRRIPIFSVLSRGFPLHEHVSVQLLIESNRMPLMRDHTFNRLSMCNGLHQ